MKARWNYASAAPGAFDAVDGLEHYLEGCSLETPLLHLVRLRASQINGCAYCIDMHWKDLRALGEGEDRLYALDSWRESPLYTERERAALLWTEAVTVIHADRVPDATYQAVRGRLNETEMADLTMAVATINAWNRLSIASRLVPGGYRPAVAAG